MRRDAGVHLVAIVRVRGQHLARDLSVAWLVRAHQPKLRAAEQWNQAIKEKVRRNRHENEELTERAADLCARETAQPRLCFLQRHTDFRNSRDCGVMNAAGSGMG